MGKTVKKRQSHKKHLRNTNARHIPRETSWKTGVFDGVLKTWTPPRGGGGVSRN